MAGDRETLRAMFDEDALRYDRARPTYPPALLDEIDRRLTTSPPRTLEIGCGTGQATAALARRGHRVLAVELGAALADVARARLADFPDVEVVTADVERWEPEVADVDLVVCATSFHWLDPATRFARVARLLRPGGLLALVQTIHVSGPSDAFFADVQRSCYERWDPDAPPGLRLVPLKDLPTASAYGIEDAAEFHSAQVRRFRADHRYDAEQYLDLVGTFSNHLALPAARRAGLLACLREHVLAQPGGTIVRSVAFELGTALRCT
ncbi:class I SAM-dependent methyltransferase [Actinomycetospora chiangmaiensis]|uniref:class I SAM-dependent methyltransferase n=1 Tax=Actinomycetospora chiangmaiensis TaxID=402650 RepID=UPI000375BCE9|nr:class I SAM-dependent methyltransferase [Actinomycetospora chiangmaiensis]